MITKLTMVSITINLASCNKTFHLFRTGVRLAFTPITSTVKDCIGMSVESLSLVSQIITLVTIVLFSHESQVELIIPLLNTQRASTQVTKKCTLCSKAGVILSITIFLQFHPPIGTKWAINSAMPVNR